MSQMTGKTALVTGATNGIGLAIAHGLAEQGANVVVVGRDPDKCRGVVAALPRIGPGQSHWHHAADLSSMRQVDALARKVSAEQARLDVLVNNAGAWFSTRQVSEEGIEMTWALNHLQYFRLTQGLLQLLKDTARQHGEARIISQSSGAHHEGQMRWDDLQFTRDWEGAGRGSVGAGWAVYSQSKLANVLFTLALARRLQGTGVTANAVHPGVVVTGFSQNNGLLYRLAAPIRRMRNQKTPADGAAPAIHVASAPAMKGVSGKYFAPPNVEEPVSAAARDAAAQERLWEVSAAQA